MPSVTVLCGGFGAARFLSGLSRVGGVDLTCVVNTADDLDYEGLHISPDVDTVTYALAGRFDEDRGWGLAGDTFRNAEALRRYRSGWFAVGDEDLATNLARTNLIRAGATLTEATARVAAALGVRGRVLPMSDDPVRTVVCSAEGRLGFQEYLVHRRAGPAVEAVEHDGADTARPAPGVLGALAGADLVVVAPSNPVSSIGPILALGGVAGELALRADRTVAVTPVVSGAEPATAPEQSRARVRAAFMAARGLAHDATGTARAYQGLAGGFVLDQRDADQREAITELGYDVRVADTLAPPGPARRALAEAVLSFAP